MADPLRRRLRARALAALTRTAGVLPAGAVAGALNGAAALARRGRNAQIARENLRRVYAGELDEVQLEALLRATYRHAARQLREWMALARGEDLAAGVEFDPSIERFDAALAGGRGVLVVSAHLGNWELIAAALRRRGARGHVVGRQRERDPSSAWWLAMRRAYGVETLPQNSPPRRLLEVLRRGHVLGLITDLDVRRLDGVHLPFLGHPALTMTAPAALARAARVPLLPIRCVVPPGAQHYRLSVEAPLTLDPALPRQRARDELLLRQNQAFERWIRATPEQWAWHQPRWRTPPPEEPEEPGEPGAGATGAPRPGPSA